MFIKYEYSAPHFLNMYKEAYKFPIKVRGGMVVQIHKRNKKIKKTIGLPQFTFVIVSEKDKIDKVMIVIQLSGH